MRRLWDVFTVNSRTYTKLFDIRRRVDLYTTFDMRIHVCVQFPTLFPIPSPNATRLYKIVSTVRRDDVHVFTKMTDLCTILTYKDVPAS